MIEHQTEGGMAPILKRQKFKRGESKDFLLEKLKTSKLEGFKAQKSLSRGTYPNATNIVVNEHGFPPPYRTEAFRVTAESVLNPWKVELRLSTDSTPSVAAHTSD